ncbi:MAG: hypothetical protein EBZ03_05195 [Betaproteobacteria bacterium]|nr:hypothetical protein [Betaproteobacteria bacterium]NBO44117.1 hypothetical protein [Betaproteobacteria bacterium]NBP09894.1 hypothetical protein [Betaproteobacteria bacterium]NBP61657.1 hypothetical protein [Betaproteobacteria bacterium]NBQ09188.1 hypothetical protein [Betaproteobacteria bacterium]
MATAKKPAAKQSAAKKPAAKAAASKAPASKATASKPAASKAATRTTEAKANSARKAVGKDAETRTPNAAFMKPMTPSAALAAVIGAKPMPRTEVTKRLWDYIKAKNLQDPTNKRQINADAALEAVFGQSSVSMFEMTKLVGKHLS